MKRIVVFSGAGVSAESGLSTFRDHGGLWDQYPIEEVATIDAWNKDPEKVINFYNLSRDGCRKAKPNLAHQLIAKLESKYLVHVITQNIDDLHERAGSSQVLHLHLLFSLSYKNAYCHLTSSQQNPLELTYLAIQTIHQ